MSQELIALLAEICKVCLLPLLATLTAFLVKLIKNKTNEITAALDNELAAKYVTMLSETITSCVIATNQTYVESLKKQDKFDLDAQKIAFQMTLDAVLAVLNDDAKKYLSEAYGDLNTYITTQIEAAVNQNKIEIVK